MAQAIQPQSLAALRAVIYRLSSTPSKQLPHVAPQIAASLWNCRDALSASQESNKSSTEIATLLHRFKTNLSSLLQDRTVEGRWAAVVLVKATMEAGGVETVSKSNGWVRSLLAILKKPDPPTTRNPAVIALTRIFMLTWDHANLVREITTPALPAFIASCLSNVEKKHCSANELLTVLEAFTSVIPRHPTIFRTHESQIRSLLVQVLSTTSSTSDDNRHYTDGHRLAAERLFVLLHRCAPKEGAAEKWDESIKATVSAAHSTCDRLFRSVVENWISAAGFAKTALPTGDVEWEGADAAGLSGWKGIFAGAERLISLLSILKSHIQSATAGAVTVRIGLLVDLLIRLVSVTVPNGDHFMKINNEIAKDEREAMFSVLPGIHVAALELCDIILDRFGMALLSIMQSLLEGVLDVFSAERHDINVRAAVYRTIRTLLELTGPSMSRNDVQDLRGVMEACCNDLLPSISSNGSAPNGVQPIPQPAKADMLHTSNVLSTRPTILTSLLSSTVALLPVLISKVDPAHMPSSVRVQIERTAILSRHKDALIACVLYPARDGPSNEVQPSLLPLLARGYPDSAEVEALLRPRMPPIATKAARAGDAYEEESVNDGDDNGYAAVNAGGASARDDLEDGYDPADDSEPTAGLLSALGQDDSPDLRQKDNEDLYSATPPRAPRNDPAIGPDFSDVNESLEQQLGTKRTAAEPANGETSPKRARASPLAEAGNGALPDSGRTLTQTSNPVTVSLGDSEQMATIPQLAPADTAETRRDADVGSDDSDFEMPPLTMEPDTDPEDEEEDDED